MNKAPRGFSAVETLLILALLALVVGVGYFAYHAHYKTTASTSGSTTQSASGASPNIDAITSKDTADEESDVDASYAATQTTAAQSTDQAAANLGGAYNETTF